MNVIYVNVPSHVFIYSYIKLMLPVMYSYIQTNVFAHCRQVVEDVACFSRVKHFYVGEIRSRLFQIAD